jgi:acetoacetyl-CoA reductase
MAPLSGKVALVTGGSRGIGRAIVEALAGQGADVAINYVQSAAEAQDLASQLQTSGARAIAVQANVGIEDEARGMVDRTVSELGRMDFLVNNAGIGRDRAIQNMTGEDWRAVMDVNLNGTFYCTSAAIPHMIEAGGGKIINIASVLGALSNLGQVNYATSKAAIVGFTHAAAMELTRYNISMNAVCPGFIETDMMSGITDRKREQFLSRIPMGRFGTAEEIASLVRYLIVEQHWSTGQAFSVNGGQYVTI